MKQIQFTFKDQDTLDRELKKIRQCYESHLFSGMLIHIYTEILDRDRIEDALESIEKQLPEAEYVGCSSNGNIVLGDFSGDSFAVICTLFESPSTRIKVLQYRLTRETQAAISEAVIREVQENDWVRGIEFLLTIRGMSLTGLCDGLSRVREGVQIFGGGAFSEDINVNDACVFSGQGGFQEKGIVFILLGGKDFHVNASFVSGWKPLGSFLSVTDADGAILKELNGRPAYETYYRYLRIRNDENFFYHTLEFPFIYRDNGYDVMRAPTACNPDGSLVMTSDIAPNVMARLAYGDPWTILESTRKEADRLVAFGPECISVFSCAGRRTFWGNDQVGRETSCYQKVAPTSGFYTSSEFLRSDGHVIQHNVTQVVVAFREGDPVVKEGLLFASSDQAFDGKVPMINRMASFINTTMEELEEANQKLSRMAVTDALTGLLNRGEIQRLITEAVEHKKMKDVYLVMMDLDNFKHVNDTYGHKEGDNVLIRLSGMMRETIVDMGDTCFCGRWGGEEFMIMMYSCDRASVIRHSEWIRKTMEGIHFEKAGQVTISIGITRVKADESADQACLRVDEALYRAKSSGKNTLVTMWD